MKVNLPENIATIKPYTSARDLLNDHIRVFLDANENPFNSGLNRYPDPAQKELTNKLANLKEVPAENMLLSNGSDEAIDLLLKAFCQPGIDKGLIFSPTYGIYNVRASVNNIELIDLPLDENFQLQLREINKIIRKPELKIIFICSPNNPTGHVFDNDWILELAGSFHGILIVDEAYIDFSSTESLINETQQISNLVVIQTLSKSWGMASARIGITIAATEIINVLRSIKLPYNISGNLQKEVLKRLDKRELFERNIGRILEYRASLKLKLENLSEVLQVYPSEANFLLVKFKYPDIIFNSLIKNGIQVRDFSKKIEGCLRLSIGTQSENNLLIQTIKKSQS